MSRGTIAAAELNGAICDPIPQLAVIAKTDGGWDLGIWPMREIEIAREFHIKFAGRTWKRLGAALQVAVGVAMQQEVMAPRQALLEICVHYCITEVRVRRRKRVFRAGLLYFSHGKLLQQSHRDAVPAAHTWPSNWPKNYAWAFNTWHPRLPLAVFQYGDNSSMNPSLGLEGRSGSRAIGECSRIAMGI